MKKILIALVILMSQNLIAQKEDYVWVVGHDYNFQDALYGRVEIDFITVPLITIFYATILVEVTLLVIPVL